MSNFRILAHVFFLIKYTSNVAAWFMLTSMTSLHPAYTRWPLNTLDIR